jgi:pyruvate,water dikinase
VWQDMLGVKNRDISLRNINNLHKFGFFSKTKLSLNVIYHFFRCPKDMVKLETEFNDLKTYFEKTFSENLTLRELKNLYKDIEKLALNNWHVTLMNDLYSFVWTALLKRKLVKKGLDVTEYISNISGLESLKPVKELVLLSKKYGKENNITDIPEVLEYIEKFGDRCAEELKLECETFRQNPELLAEQMRIYAEDEALLTFEKNSPQQLKNSFSVKKAKTGISNREISRLNRTRLYGMVRSIFTAVGKLRFGENWRDIFYLTIDEAFSEDFNSEEIFKIIQKRKKEYDNYKNLPAKNRLIFRDNTLISDDVSAVFNGELQGIGTSPGKFSGEAVVLTYPSADTDVTGKVIVTKTTDPGWVFLMCRAKAIIAEKGSIMSHTTIVARELGIPAVVGIDNVTLFIKSGDILNIDADSGSVKIVQGS